MSSILWKILRQIYKSTSMNWWRSCLFFWDHGVIEKTIARKSKLNWQCAFSLTNRKGRFKALWVIFQWISSNKNISVIIKRCISRLEINDICIILGYFNNNVTKFSYINFNTSIFVCQDFYDGVTSLPLLSWLYY